MPQPSTEQGKQVCSTLLQRQEDPIKQHNGYAGLSLMASIMHHVIDLGRFMSQDSEIPIFEGRILMQNIVPARWTETNTDTWNVKMQKPLFSLCSCTQPETHHLQRLWIQAS